MDSIAILTVGDELVEGRLVDSNAGWLSDQLTTHGLVVAEHRSVGDDRRELVAALRELAERRSAVLVSGGLGPTSDDLTAACAAQAFGVPLTRVGAAVEHLDRFFTARGREMAPTNLKQADLPEGCSPMPNPRGTALGFTMTSDDALLFFMPGVPHELRGMFEDSVLPQLVERINAAPPLFATVKIFGLGESDVAQRLEGDESVAAPRGDLQFQYRATFPEIHVRLLLRGGDEASLDTVLCAARDRLGGHVYASGTGDVSKTHAETVVEALTAKGLSLAVHDRLTGGLLTATLLDAARADEVLKGAEVAAKPGRDLEGEASEIRKRFSADLGVALASVDGPAGLEAVVVGDGENPVRRVVHFPLPADRMRRLGVSVGLELLRRYSGS